MSSLSPNLEFCIQFLYSVTMSADSGFYFFEKIMLISLEGIPTQIRIGVGYITFHTRGSMSGQHVFFIKSNQIKSNNFIGIKSKNRIVTIHTYIHNMIITLPLARNTRTITSRGLQIKQTKPCCRLCLFYPQPIKTIPHVSNQRWIISCSITYSHVIQWHV